MNVLVDTHAVLWWLAGNAHISRRARRILEDSKNRRLVSIASLWEIAIKMSMGRLPGKDLTLRVIADQLEEQEFILLPIRLGDLLRLEQLPALHRDPFDRVLVCQALEEGIPLLTADELVAEYPIRTIW